jgi:hypothetical protein
MSEAAEKTGYAAEVEVADVVLMMVRLYAMGRATGKAIAYHDVLTWTDTKLKDAEEFLVRDSRNAHAIAECMAFHQIASQYKDADNWNAQKAVQEGARFRELCEKLGLIEVFRQIIERVQDKMQ